MFEFFRAGHQRRRCYAPREPCHPEPLTLPEEHPCRNCPVLSRETGLPYCFLPKCRRELFLCEGDIDHEENPETSDLKPLT